jgi:sugar-specific transcriptional regulator TrmB
LGYHTHHLQTLNQLGLTPNQGKIYLTLLHTGKTTGSIISKETGLARQEIYRILNELHTLGLIEKIINTPTEFQAIPIQEGISVLMMKKCRELEQTKEQIQSLVDEYTIVKCTIPQKEYKFLMIPPKTISHEARERMFQNSKETIQLISTNKRFSQGISHFFEVWENTLKRNVVVQVIIVGDETKFKGSPRLRHLQQYPNFNAAFTHKPGASLLIVDKSEAIVTLEPKGDLGASPVLWTNHPEVLSIYIDYFTNLWELAKMNPQTNDFVEELRNQES